VTARLPRSDARDNRGRILDAACAAFVAGGLDVPIREIARRAQVGPATVYRHFPTKQMLLAAPFIEHSLAWRAALDDGLADPYPWRGFRLAVSRIADRGFATLRGTDDTGVSHQRHRPAHRAYTRLHLSRRHGHPLDAAPRRSLSKRPDLPQTTHATPTFRQHARRDLAGSLYLWWSGCRVVGWCGRWRRSP
jgi:AcrR family transcriptional regulator